MDLLFSPKGRIDRRVYLAVVLGWIISVILIQRFIVGLPDFASSGRLMDLLWNGGALEWGPQVDAGIQAAGSIYIRYVAFGLILIAAFASFLCVSAKRLHDLGRPAVYAWISLVPSVGAEALFVVLVLLPGDAGANSFGPARHSDRRHGAQDYSELEPVP